MVEMNTLTVDGTQYEIVDATARIYAHSIITRSATHSFSAQTAGSHGYFQVTWGNTVFSRPIGIYVHTTSISALNGAQFSVVNATATGAYITYHFPFATSATIQVTVYAFYQNPME